MDFILEKIIEYWDMILYPESWSQILLSAVILGALGIVIIAAFTQKARRAGRSLVAFSVVASIYMLTIWYLVPKLQELDDSIIGVVIPRIGGDNVGTQFAETPINEMLAVALQSVIEERGLEEHVRVIAIPWKVESLDDAEGVKAKFAARAIWFGYGAKLDSGYLLHTTFDAGEISFSKPWSKAIDDVIIFRLLTAPPYHLRFDDRGESLRMLIEEMALDLLPVIVAKLWEDDPRWAIGLADQLLANDPRMITLPLAPFLLCAMAGHHMDNGSFGEAEKMFTNAFTLFDKLKCNQLRNERPESIDDSLLRPYAGYALFSEGICAFRRGDTAHARTAILMAAFVDDANAAMYLRDAQRVLKIDLVPGDSTVFQTSRTCFAPTGSGTLKSVPLR